MTKANEFFDDRLKENVSGPEVIGGVRYDTVIRVDPGPVVLCDFCNTEYTESDEQGGILIGSNAVCPQCVAGGAGSKYPHEVKARCPEGMSFRDWVYSLRG
jgi:hypothetical protein